MEQAVILVRSGQYSAKVSFNSHLHKLFFAPFGRQITQLAGQISQLFSKGSEVVLSMQSSERKQLWFETPVCAPSCSDLVAFQFLVNDRHRFWCLHPTLIVPAANISYIILLVKVVSSYIIQGLVHRLNLTPRSIVTQGKSHLFIVWERWEKAEGLSAFSSWRIAAGSWDLSTMTPEMWLIDS